MATKAASTKVSSTKVSSAKLSSTKAAPRKPAAAARPAASSRKKFLAKVRENLKEMRSRLLHGMESDLKAEREGNKDEGMDTYDLASEERDREISFILSDREHDKIRQIDEALGRLDEGAYGVCESCGLEIGEERLEAMPFTRLCRDCQQDQEREARTQRRFDEERNVYRKLGTTDNEDEGP